MRVRLVQIIYRQRFVLWKTWSRNTRRENRVWRDGKSWPSGMTERLFISRSMHEETVVPPAWSNALCSGCLKSVLSVLSPAIWLHFFSFSVSFLFALFWREATIVGEMLLARREDLERRIFRDTKGNVSRRSGLIIRFRGADERRKERRLLARARGQTRTILDRSFALLPQWKDGNRITLITTEI